MDFEVSGLADVVRARKSITADASSNAVDSETTARDEGSEERPATTAGALSTRSADYGNLPLARSSPARDSGDTAFLKASNLSYSRALVGLQRDLLCNGSSDAVLGTCVTLLCFNVSCETPGMNDVVAHLGGLAALMCVREPSRFVSGVAYHTFGPSRLCLIHVASSRSKERAVRFSPRQSGSQSRKGSEARPITTPSSTSSPMCRRSCGAAQMSTTVQASSARPTDGER